MHLGAFILYVFIHAQLSCIGAVVAAVFTVNKIVELNNTDSELLPKEIRLPNLIDVVEPNIRTQLEATAAVAIVSGIVIPLGFLMVLIRPCGFEQYKCGRMITALVKLLLKFYEHFCMQLQNSNILGVGFFACFGCCFWLWSGRSIGCCHC